MVPMMISVDEFKTLLNSPKWVKESVSYPDNYGCRIDHQSFYKADDKDIDHVLIAHYESGQWYLRGTIVIDSEGLRVPLEQFDDLLKSTGFAGVQ